MSRPRLTRRALVAVTSSMLLVTAACGRAKDSPDSAHVAVGTSTAVQNPTTLLGASRGTAASRLPGALSKPIEQFTPDEFYTFVHSLAFGGGATKARKCKNDSSCAHAGGKTTSARVDAVDGQDSLSVGALSTNGAVAVRARNMGQLQEARYGMLPGPFEYYMVITPATAGLSKWTLQQLDTTSGARRLAQVGIGTFEPCNHPFKKGSLRASFFSCRDSHMTADSTMKMGLLLQDPTENDPIWISCAMGCCTFT